jgi:hypothetical protein
MFGLLLAVGGTLGFISEALRARDGAVSSGPVLVAAVVMGIGVLVFQNEHHREE